MQPGIVVAQMAGFEVLNRLYDDRRNQVHRMPDPPQLFEGVHQDGGRGAQKIGGAAGDAFPVWKLQRNGRQSGGFGPGSAPPE